MNLSHRDEILTSFGTIRCSSRKSPIRIGHRMIFFLNQFESDGFPRQSSTANWNSNREKLTAEKRRLNFSEEVDRMTRVTQDRTFLRFCWNNDRNSARRMFAVSVPNKTFRFRSSTIDSWKLRCFLWSNGFDSTKDKDVRESNEKTDLNRKTRFCKTWRSPLNKIFSRKTSNLKGKFLFFD